MGELLRVGRLSIYAGKIQRGNNGANPAWRGYCWGSDFPRVKFSANQGACYCLDLSWLMFYANIYWSHQ